MPACEYKYKRKTNKDKCANIYAIFMIAGFIY